MQVGKKIITSAFTLGFLVAVSGIAFHSQIIRSTLPPSLASPLYGVEIIACFLLFGLACSRFVAHSEQTEQDLQVTNEILKSSEKMAAMGSWHLDISTNKLTWSDAVYEIFGIKKEGFKATYEAFLDTVHPDDKELVNDAYNHAIQNNIPYEVVHRIIRADGRVRVVREKSENILDANGRPLHSFGIVQDITEAHQQEQQKERLIKQLQKSLDEVKILRGILPICLFCKKIRDDDGYWAGVDEYVKQHSELVLTDSICPDCIARHAPTEPK